MRSTMRTGPRVDTHRKLALAGFLVCTGLIGFALWLQYVAGLEPCPLCMIQRVCFAAVGVVFLVAAIAGPHGFFVKVYGTLAALLAATGAGFAMRHVWLQWYPPETESCTADLFTQLQRLPFASVIERALYATGDCARVDWRFLGLSIAEWSLVWFVALLLWALVYLTRRQAQGDWPR